MLGTTRARQVGDEGRMLALYGGEISRFWIDHQQRGRLGSMGAVRPSGFSGISRRR